MEIARTGETLQFYSIRSQARSGAWLTSVSWSSQEELRWFTLECVTLNYIITTKCVDIESFANISYILHETVYSIV
jgi:hypothetical protein